MTCQLEIPVKKHSEVVDFCKYQLQVAQSRFKTTSYGFHWRNDGKLLFHCSNRTLLAKVKRIFTVKEVIDDDNACCNQT